MLIYLDNCVFNRPFDDQNHLRIRLETEAKLYIQEQIKKQTLKLVWSYILEFENQQNPFMERKNAVLKWKQFAFLDVGESDSVLEIANTLFRLGINAKDALHVACAVAGKARYFLTTDDKLLKKFLTFREIEALTLTEFVKVLDDDD